MERRDAIRMGVLSDPEKPTSLKDAITPVGTCQDMCPEFERVERIVQKMTDGCEKVGVFKLVNWAWLIHLRPGHFLVTRHQGAVRGIHGQEVSKIRSWLR